MFTPLSRRLLCGATLSAATLACSAAVAFAEPAPDYSRLAADPNVITDSTAYLAGPPVVNPDGQPGVQQSFTHRDNSRTITDTVLVLPDTQAAAAQFRTLESELADLVVGGTTQTVPVGDNGTIVSGTSPDGSESVSVLLFTRGATATQIEFAAGPDDPAPVDLVVEYGQRQVDTIAQQLNQ